MLHRSIFKPHKQQTRHEAWPVVCKESDDDLLWFRHHINEADMSLHRNKPLRGVLSEPQVGHKSNSIKQKAQHKVGLFALWESDDDLLSHG